MHGLTIKLDYNRDINIELPNKQVINILLSYVEPGEQHPEIDIKLPSILAVNCFAEHFANAEQLDDFNKHIRLSRQLIIPIEV